MGGKLVNLMWNKFTCASPLVLKMQPSHSMFVTTTKLFTDLNNPHVNGLLHYHHICTPLAFIKALWITLFIYFGMVIPPYTSLCILMTYYHKKQPHSNRLTNSTTQRKIPNAGTRSLFHIPWYSGYFNTYMATHSSASLCYRPLALG